MSPLSQSSISEVAIKHLTFYSYNDGVPRPQLTRHIKRTRHTQFHAPTVALILTLSSTAIRNNLQLRAVRDRLIKKSIPDALLHI